MRGSSRSIGWQAAAILTVAAVAAACGGQIPSSTPGTASSGPTGSATPPSSAAAPGGTLTFGTPGEAANLDAILASDNESYRVLFQIDETLVKLAPGSGTDVEPGLAESWTSNAEQTEWTFKIRSGVQFHDGTSLNAAAVKANFDRWVNLPEELQGFAELYGAVFDGFGLNSNIASVTAPDEATVVVSLRSARSTFLQTLSLIVFGIQSPDALKQYDADNPDLTKSTYGTEHPTGTGPFRFSEWVKGDHITLVRNEDYWGPAAQLDSVIFRPIADPAARLNALQSGDIQGFDLVNPVDIDAIKADTNLALVPRESCNVGYLGLVNNKPPLDNVSIRRAITQAINKQAIIDRFYKDTGSPATLFLAPSVANYDTSLQDYPYDPEGAKKLIAESGVTDLSLDFAYPSDVTRPYMPDPKGIFEAMRADLEAVGFTINPITSTFTDYRPRAQAGEFSLYLLGWICDYAAPDNFYYSLFSLQEGKPQARFAYGTQELQAALDAAVNNLDAAKADELWSEVEKIVLADVPAVPYAHGAPALAFSSRVSGYVTNPTLAESFSTVSLAP